MCILEKLFLNLFYNYETYMIFVILLTPAPFLAENLTQKKTKFQIFTPKHFFDTRLKFLTPTLHVVHVTNIRYITRYRIY